jgi:hypothetical protein
VDSPTNSPPAATAASLTGLRIAAAIGLLVAIAAVVVGFLVVWWLGVVAVAMMPVLPMISVQLVEAVRRA